MHREVGLLLASLVVASCSSSPEPVSIRLVEHFEDARVENAQSPTPPAIAAEWRFDDGTTQDPLANGWSSLDAVRGLSVQNGTLVGRTTSNKAVLAVEAPDTLDPDDTLHAIEIRMRASSGDNLGVAFEQELDTDAVIQRITAYNRFPLAVSLRPGDDLQTYTLTSAVSNFDPSFPLAAIGHVLIQPSDVADAEFAIESVRIISRKEHLSSIASGVGWHGLADVFRETIVTRAPESVAFDVELPSHPFLDLAIGTIEEAPVTFRVSVGDRILLERTLTRPRQWQTVPVDLEPFANRPTLLTFSLIADSDGALGYWGAPVIRNRNGAPRAVDGSPARDAVTEAEPPQGVILIVGDTLRRDHFQPYGYERENAPVLTRLAEDGVRFDDNISQGTWTKVSVSSILTSLYPSTTGVSDLHHRIAASVTTLAEAYNDAGYATVGYSSVPFTGKLTNLHQGVEELHERSSIAELDGMNAKTARPFGDRLLEWLEAHRDVPFFAFYHVMDPHSPFKPERPYDTMWLDPERAVEHETLMKDIQAFIDFPFMKIQSLPDQDEMDHSGIDEALYVGNEKAWYDGSIRGMDAEVGRLMERLHELELDDRVVVAFIADHGEEFLEHGRHWHGHTAYGEMINVPLILWGPRFVPQGRVVEETVQSIDLMPTLLELSRLSVPGLAQGQSLLPLLADGAPPNELGWRHRPVFAERAIIESEPDPKGRDVASLVIIADGWKLIVNGERPDGWPEIELFDHVNDPLDMTNVAGEHPDVVARLREQLENWHKAAVAARISTEDDVEGLSTEDLERLKSLGYVQ